MSALLWRWWKRRLSLLMLTWVSTLIGQFRRRFVWCVPVWLPELSLVACRLLLWGLSLSRLLRARFRRVRILGRIRMPAVFF
nr:MAG TPA: hypothetical protein [Caudoviricetes sp.]